MNVAVAINGGRRGPSAQAAEGVEKSSEERLSTAPHPSLCPLRDVPFKESPMTTRKKTASKKKPESSAKKAAEVLKPRKGVHKISEEKLEEISGGGREIEGERTVCWAVDRS